VILPVAVTLKRFFALEFVLTFGILKCFICFTLEVFPHRWNPYWTSLGIFPFFQTERKDKVQDPENELFGKEIFCSCNSFTSDCKGFRCLL
jgi:hypothetical protein